MKNLCIFILCASLTTVTAQETYYDQNSIKQMKELSSMVGQWEGEGWALNRESRQKDPFQQTEDIRYVLGETAIQIEGKGTHEGEVIHHAQALITAGGEWGEYDFHSFLGNGRKGAYKMQKFEDRIEWYIPLEGSEIRYTIRLTKDSWNEVGEYKMKGEWLQFFEMNLKKVNIN
jgi:hypothetical protein